MPSAAPAAPAPYYPPVRRAAGQGPGLVRDWRQEGRSHKVGQGLRTKADRMQRHRGGEHREQLTGAQAAGCGGHADRSSPLRSVFRAWHAWAPCVRCCPDPSAAHARVPLTLSTCADASRWCTRHQAAGPDGAELCKARHTHPWGFVAAAACREHLLRRRDEAIAHRLTRCGSCPVCAVHGRLPDDWYADDWYAHELPYHQLPHDHADHARHHHADGVAPVDRAAAHVLAAHVLDADDHHAGDHHAGAHAHAGAHGDQDGDHQRDQGIFCLHSLAGTKRGPGTILKAKRNPRCNSFLRLFCAKLNMAKALQPPASTR